MATAEVKRHWSRVAALGCIVTQHPNPQLHHTHSRELSAMGFGRGVAQKPSDWLVIPLSHDYHVGRFGIDSGMGVATWEKLYGSQLEHLKTVCYLLGVDVFAKAREEQNDK